MVNTRSRSRGIIFDRLSQERRYQREEEENNARRQASPTFDDFFNNYSPEDGLEWSDNDDEEECEECSQASAASDYQRDFGTGYNPYTRNDHCHRHRARDDSPYTEQVVAYRRRKPRRT